MKKSHEKILFVLGMISFVVLLLIILMILALFLLSHSTLGVSEEDTKFMLLAYEEAEKALEFGDAPIGSILVVDGVIIAKAHNTVVLGEDHRNHAEMLVIEEGLRTLNITLFDQTDLDITLYTTYEPCSMCEGFILWKKVPRVVVGKKKSFSKLFGETTFRKIVYRFNERGGIYESKHDELMSS